MTANTANRRAAAVLFLVVAAMGCNPAPPAPKTASATSAVQPAPQRVPVTTPPAVKKHLYSAESDPKADIASALKQARTERKRVLLDFGGDWCGDCQVLDIYFHQPGNLELLQNNFVLVHIDIGHKDKNLDIAQRYGVPIDQGVPALAVLDPTGKVLFAQSSGQFADMRYMQSSSVHDFLDRWKA